MSSELEHLGPSELLVLYLADELSPGDREEMERRLAIDAGLSAELERLRGAYAVLHDAFAAADHSSGLPVKADVAVRRTARAMQEWQIRRASQAIAAGENPREFRVPWWSYPIAAAAWLIIA